MKTLKQYSYYIITSISIITIIIITCFLNNTREVIAKVEEKKTEPVKTIKVDVKGAIATPGVYELNINSRVIDAINMAGGVIEGANTSLINLSKKLTDEMVIIIYTNDEIREYNEGKIKTEYVYIEVNNCPDKINNACINEHNEETAETNSLVNINEASVNELTSLPSIGESKANAIIEYRNEKKFEKIEDIKNVSGIGDSLYEKIKDKITI